MSMEKVLVGMSGGIDSFVAALLLREQGYEVWGVTLELWEKNDTTHVAKICNSLGIPLLYQEARELFREKVVQSFVQGYLSGCTPSPCCICNGQVKWEVLNRVAQQYQIPYVATGHYVRIKQLAGKYYIQCGVDPQKDQSYFLYGLSQEILAKAITPLGHYTKAEVRDWAMAHGYPFMVGRKESMGICFLKEKDYREFIRERIEPEKMDQTGLILDREGRELGKHRGVMHYTIGQKKDLPFRDGQPLYVAEIDPIRNVIVADVKSALWRFELQVKDAYWVEESDLYQNDITIKVRGLGLNPKGIVQVERMAGNTLHLLLSEPAWAIAPGQPVALFRGDLLIGGGIAEK